MDKAIGTNSSASEKKPKSRAELLKAVYDWLEIFCLSAVLVILLFTFVAFFIFAGNMSRIEAVREVFSFLLEKNTLVFSALSCQVISNVPAALLLSGFTENGKELMRSCLWE